MSTLLARARGSVGALVFLAPMLLIFGLFSWWPIVRSFITPGVEPVWVLPFLLCLCGLAVVAALLRDPAHRRHLLGAAVALTVAAVGFFLLAVS